MDSAGKRTWKKKLDEDMNKNAKTLPSGIRVAGGMYTGTSSAGTSKKKAKQMKQPAELPTAQSITFEGLNGAECRKWWQETPDNHLVKASIRKAQVEWAVQMPVFCIRDYEKVLRIMIETYDRFSRSSTFEYLGCKLTVAFRPADFTRVFGIPGHAQGGRKIESKPRKLSREVKLKLIQLACGDLSQVEQEALSDTSKGRGLKKCSIQEGHWRCLMDIVKSRLTGSSRASDISFPHVAMMNGILHGIVYDWATLLAERMSEFMTLQHKTFYMPHYAIGLFLDATSRMIPHDALESKPGPLTLGEPPIMQWKHLDTLGTKPVGQKRPRPDGCDTDSGREETSSEENGSEGEEEDDEEVEVITAIPLRFPRPVLSATTHLVPLGGHGIPGFGQFRQSVVMTPVPTTTHTEETQAASTEIVAPQALRESACETLSETGETLVRDMEMEIDTETGVLEVPVGEELGASGVRLDVVGSDAVVTVDTALLASPAQDSEREDRTQRVSAFLSTKFHRTPAPRATYVPTPLPTPTREAVSEDPSQEVVQEQSEGVPHNVVERMADAVEEAMGAQQEHPLAQETAMTETIFLEDVTALASRAREVLASAKTQALESMGKELERVISFIRTGCPAAFTVCFEERGWPEVETTEMRQDWSLTREPEMEGRMETLIQEIARLHREIYYTLRRSQADQIAAERAREESAARFASERAAWESERAAWQSERTALLSEKEQLAAANEQLVAEKEKMTAEKEKELGEVGEMMQSALELQLEAEAELKIRREQVYKLRAELQMRMATTPGTHPSV